MAIIPAFFGGTGAHAQENIPALMLDTQTLSESGIGFSQDVRPTFNYENPYLNDTLILQYQNILLQKMVQRQSAIARTESSFIDVGVPFMQPPPPRGICEQIPVNVPCYKAYPDLYPGAVADVSQIEDGALETQDITPVSTAPTSVPEKKIAPPSAPDFSAYRWAEITCAGGQCTAVVTHNGARRSVRSGDMLTGGIRVERITATGIDVSKGGKSEALQAALAPSRGGAASPKYKNYATGNNGLELSGSMGEQSQQLEEYFARNAAKAPATVSPSSEINTASPPATALESDTPEPPSAEIISEPTDPGPPLGPTGLF